MVTGVKACQTEHEKGGDAGTSSFLACCNITLCFKYASRI